MIKSSIARLCLIRGPLVLIPPMTIAFPVVFRLDFLGSIVVFLGLGLSAKLEAAGETTRPPTTTTS